MLTGMFRKSTRDQGEEHKLAHKKLAAPPQSQLCLDSLLCSCRKQWIYAGQWHTPDRHVRKRGCIAQKSWKSEYRNHTRTATMTGHLAACFSPDPYLFSLHPTSFSMFAFSTISYRSRRLVEVYWDATCRGQNTTPAGGKQIRGGRKRWHATEAQPTWILGVWVQTRRSPGAARLFCFCQLTSPHPLLCNYGATHDGGDIGPKICVTISELPWT